MDFDYVKYRPSPHARDRAVERVPGANKYNVKEKFQQLIEKGTLLFDINPGDGKCYRYFKSGDFFIPCIKYTESLFFIMSVIDWKMILRNENTSDFDALQWRLHRYHYH